MSRVKNSKGGAEDGDADDDDDDEAEGGGGGGSGSGSSPIPFRATATPPAIELAQAGFLAGHSSGELLAGSIGFYRYEQPSGVFGL